MQTEQPIPNWLLVIIKIPRAIIRNVFKGRLRPLLDWFNRQMTKLDFHFSAHETFDGINLYCFDGDEKEIFFEMVIKALKLLQNHDSRRYSRVKKYIKNIAVLPTPSGHFDKETFSFIVDTYDPNRPSQFAAGIVHEATHGMLFSLGFKYDLDKKRHETICIREEFLTARRLIYRLNPDMAPEKQAEMVEAWRSWMEMSLRGEWWSDHNHVRRGAARLISMWNGESLTPQGVYLTVREKDDRRDFVIRNSTACEVTVTIKLGDMKNGRSDVAFPWTKTLRPKFNGTAFTITAINPSDRLECPYTWDWRYGTPDTTHDDSYVYLLPFDHKSLQESLNGWPQSQDGSSCWHLPAGTPISVAREGTVMQVSSQTIPSQILIKHPDGSLGSYRGFTDITITEGQEVKKGDSLGTSGDKQTGGSSAEFHFYVWKPNDGESTTFFKVRFGA